MIISLNEVESLSLKACRGAGMSWGLSEEAAQAARWLAARRWAWDRSLVALLARRGEISPPILSGRDMRPAEPGGALCPIHAGAAMADLLHPGEDLTMHGILEPIWLLPFVYRRAGRRHSAALTWVDGGIVVDAAAPEVGAAAPRLLVDRLDWITFELSAPRSPERTGGRIDTSFDGTPIDPSAHAKLEAWAARTYVAASFQSRLAGAGAGLSDND